MVAAHIDVDLITDLESDLLHMVWIIEIPDIHPFLACCTEYGPFIRRSFSVDSRTEGPTRRGRRNSTIEVEVTVAPFQRAIVCGYSFALYSTP